MFKKKTVIVIGAGASEEFGLPIGQALAMGIANLVNFALDHMSRVKGGDPALWSACELLAAEAHETPRPYFGAADHIHDAVRQAPSIDSFIDDQQRNKYIEAVGKLAIVLAILRAEQSSSKLYCDPRTANASVNFRALEETWADRFWKLLRCRKEEFAERLQSLGLIIFNYDRCVEHFSHCSIQNYYRVSPEEAAKMLHSLTIYHPYGKVGDLPWQGGSRRVSFGAEPSAQQLLDLSKEIRTYSEESQGPEIGKIREVIRDAEILVFLGFAFHPMNVKLIKPLQERPRNNKPDVRYYATAYKMSQSNQEGITRRLETLKSGWRPRPHVADLRCVELFDAFWLSLEIG